MTDDTRSRGERYGTTPAASMTIPLLIAPFRPGSPASERPPMTAQRAVTGIAFPRPPSSERRCEPVLKMTAPAAMKRSDLKSMSLTIWASPASIPATDPAPMAATM